jgi:hypothetical protein
LANGGWAGVGKAHDRFLMLAPAFLGLFAMSECMGIRSLLMGVCGAGFALFFTSCASISVRDVNDREASGLRARPQQFVVEPFAVDRGRLKENPARKRPGQLATEAQQLLQTFLVAELGKLGVPATAGGRIGRGEDVWVVAGTITRIEEGNRLLRMAIGLGSGGTKMETAVNVRTAAGRSPFLRFSTTGGSNAAPGAITTPIPFSGLPTALMNSKDGVTADAARTARMIAATMADYMSKRGWLQGSYAKPKMAGR